MTTSEPLIPHLHENDAIRHFNAIGDRACFSVSPDGSLVLIRQYGMGKELTRDDFGLTTWHPVSGESETISLKPLERRGPKIHLNYVYSIGLSPDRSRFVSGHAATGGLCMCDLASRSEVDEIPNQPDIGAVGSVLFSPSGDLVAAGGSEGIAIVSVSAGEITNRFTGFIASSNQMVFPSDGKFLLCGDLHGPTRLLDVYSGFEVVTFKSVLAAEGVALSPDLQLALAGLSDGTVHLCDLKAGSEVISWYQDDAAQPLAEIYSVPPGQPEEERIVELSKDVTVAISPDSRFALSGSCGGLMRMWDLSTGREKGRFESLRAALILVAFFPDGSRLLSGYSDGSLSVWPVP